MNKLEKVNLEIATPFDNKEIGQQISREIQSADFDHPTIHIKVAKADLNHNWENIVSADDSLMLQYPFYVFTDLNLSPRNQNFPLRILFTTNDQNASTEVSIFRKIQAKHGNLVNPIIELNCNRSTLVQRLRQKPYHIWHHKGANMIGDVDAKIELAGRTLSIEKMLKLHTDNLSVPNIVFLQSSQPINELASVPMTVNLPINLRATDTARLLHGFYDRILEFPIEVALLLTRLDQYLADIRSETWKTIKLRGNSPKTKIFPSIPVTKKPLISSEIPIILFMKANPFDSGRLGIDHEFKFIRDKGLIHHSNQFSLILELAVRREEIFTLLHKHKPHILHFSGHGTRGGVLKFELDEHGLETASVSSADIAEIIKHFAPPLRCVVLNACWSEQIAKALNQYVDCIVGMSHAISDRGAKEFAVRFYQALAYGRSLHGAFEIACDAVRLTKQQTGLVNEHSIPILLCQEGVDPTKVFFRLQD